MEQILQRKIFEMKKSVVEKLIMVVLIFLVLVMGTGLLVSCGATKEYKYSKDLPSEFTLKCGDCRDLE